ncbi:MAG TPA: DNA repair protein RadC, partial [Bacteroidales bacterium]|nr:DNA repair protein RadC [Bacteroidales bacterium]
NQSIKFWSEEDRPREKLLIKGKFSLTNAELIAILIGSGTASLSAVELSRQILQSVNNNLIELSKLTIKDLQKFKGIGEAKAISIVAALELGKRRRSEEGIQRKQITNSNEVFEYLQFTLSDTPYEAFWIVLLNRANHIIRTLKISDGGMTGTVADPKRIFKMALENNAASVILCHNHPSGNVRPSDADVKLTNKLKQAGEMLDIFVTDHIIIGDNRYFSFRDEAMM